MKHLRYFDNYGFGLKDPETAQIGDFVICNDIIEDTKETHDIIEFINSNIGEIIGVDEKDFINRQRIKTFEIKYENIPDNLQNEFNPDNQARLMYIDEIIYCSTNKEALKLALTQQKYNL